MRRLAWGSLSTAASRSGSLATSEASTGGSSSTQRPAGAPSADLMRATPGSRSGLRLSARDLERGLQAVAVQPADVELGALAIDAGHDRASVVVDLEHVLGGQLLAATARGS